MDRPRPTALSPPVASLTAWRSVLAVAGHAAIEGLLAVHLPGPAAVAGIDPSPAMPPGYCPETLGLSSRLSHLTLDVLAHSRQVAHAPIVMVLFQAVFQSSRRSSLRT